MLFAQVVDPSIAKSAAFGPDIVTALEPARIRFAVPTFFTVVVNIEVVEPTTVPVGPLRLIDAGFRLAAGRLLIVTLT